MKILYVTSTPLEYSSSANLRNIALITAFSQLGHEVSILSARPETNSLYYDSSLLDIQLKEKYYIDIGNLHSQFTTKTQGSSLFMSKTKKKIRRFFNKVYTSFSLYDPRKRLIFRVKYLNMKDNYDLIISSSDPKSSHLLVEELIKLNPKIYKKWIQYWGDPFTNDINRKTKLPNFVVIREEERIISKADKIVYVSPFTLKDQVEMFPVYSSGMCFLPIPYKNKVIYNNEKNDTYTLGYFGDYYSTDRDIMPLYNAIKQYDIKLNIFGHSDISLSSTKRISINTRTQYETIKEYEKISDLLVCICNRKGTQIPGKVYHYAATNKPILIILDGENIEEMEKYFKGFNRYILCENNESSILEAMTFAKSNTTIYSPSEFFDPQHVAQQFLNTIDQ